MRAERGEPWAPRVCHTGGGTQASVPAPVPTLLPVLASELSRAVPFPAPPGPGAPQGWRPGLGGLERSPLATEEVSARWSAVAASQACVLTRDPGRKPEGR